MTRTRLFSYLTVAFLAGFVVFSQKAYASGTQLQFKQVKTCADLTCPKGQSCLMCTSSRKTTTTNGTETVESYPVCSSQSFMMQGDAVCKSPMQITAKDGKLSVDTKSEAASVAAAKSNASSFGADSTTIGGEELSLYVRTDEPTIKGNSDIASFVNKGIKEGKIFYEETSVSGKAKQLKNDAQTAANVYTAAQGEIVTKYKCDNSTLFTKTAHKLIDKNYSWYNHVGEILSTCQEDVSAADRKKLEDLAKDLEAKIKAYRHLEEQTGSRDVVYKYCVKKDKNGVCVSYVEFVVSSDAQTITSIGTAVTRGCEPLPFKLHVARACMFCPLFEVIFNTIQKASTSAFETLGKPLANVLLIGLAIWIAFMVLKNVSAMTKQDAPKFLNDLFRASFKILIIYILLTNSKIVYDIIIGPLLKAGFEFGISFLSYCDSTELSKCQSLATFRANTKGVLPNYVYQNLLCFIEAVQYELATSQAIGSSLMCISVNRGMSNIGAVANMFPDFSMMLQGALIYIISFILSLAFGFYLIDATIQLGIFGMVLPFLLLCWPFKVTNSYFGKGVGVFMNSWFVYVFMGIVVNISLTLIGQGLTGGKGGLDAVEEAINGNNVQKLQDLLGIGFTGFLVLVACCIFGVKLMMKVQDLAGTFSGGGLSLGIGNKIGGLAAAAGTGVAKNTAGLAGRMGKSALNAKIFEGKDGQYHSVADSLSALKSKAGRAVGRGMQGAGRAAGKAIGATGHAIGTVASTPVRIMRAAMRGLNRRQP